MDRTWSIQRNQDYMRRYHQVISLFMCSFIFLFLAWVWMIGLKPYIFRFQSHVITRGTAQPKFLLTSLLFCLCNICRICALYQFQFLWCNKYNLPFLHCYWVPGDVLFSCHDQNYIWLCCSRKATLLLNISTQLPLHKKLFYKNLLFSEVPQIGKH